MNLFIDTSNKYIIFVLFDSEIKFCEFIETNNNQSEIFLDRLDHFLNSKQLQLAEIDNFFVARGPGSFTGIRIGLSFAKALKVSGYEQVYTISSLELLLDNYHNSVAIIDARGQKFYYQEVVESKFLSPKVVLASELSKEISYNSYQNTLNVITQNVLNLVEKQRYSSDLTSEYVKAAF